MSDSRRDFLKKALIGTGLTLVPGLFLTKVSAAVKTFSVAWSHYTGWEPLEYARQAGMFEKWGKEFGIKIELLDPIKYIPSISLYTGEGVHACVMTNMDALAIPAFGGLDSTVLFPTSFSNGNDGIVAKDIGTVPQLKGRTVNLVQNSVSHYLLARALAMNNMSERDIEVKNCDEDFIISTFEGDPKGITVTWNPLLMVVRNVKDAKVIFDSTQIPGEIIDMMVVQTGAPEEFKRALTGAWYETMTTMSGRGKSSTDAIAYMAKVAGGTLPEFQAQLRTTMMFYNASAGVDFVMGREIKQTMEYVRTFSFAQGLFEGATSKDHVGIRFPDGSVMGNAKNVKLRFEPNYMQLAVIGKLKT